MIAEVTALVTTEPRWPSIRENLHPDAAVRVPNDVMITLAATTLRRDAERRTAGRPPLPLTKTLDHPLMI